MMNKADKNKKMKERSFRRAIIFQITKRNIENP